MDAGKTGALIAQARHELNLTQRELAARLHVSDRAVSKWERGAGFPDVSLLEPLAAELGLSAAELLRGEKGVDPERGNEVVRDAVRLARQQLWRAIRRNAVSILLVVLFLGFFSEVTQVWDRILIREKQVDCVVTAGVYTAEGEKTGEVQVEIGGEVSRRIGSKGWWYYGRFAVDGIRESGFEDARFMITQRVDDEGDQECQEMFRYRAGVIKTGPFKQGCYFAPSMQSFAVMTEDGQIIATHNGLAELMALYPCVYRLDNLGHSVYHEG